MPRGAKYFVKIIGLRMELRTPKSLLKKMIVTPNFIELWYKVTENLFDNDLWHRLSQFERNWMSELVNKLNIKNNIFSVQSARDSEELINKLQLAEGSLAAGNNSKELINNYYDLLDQLAERNIIARWTITAIKKNINKTLV